MYLWAVEYEWQGEARSMLVESEYDSRWMVHDSLHPALLTKHPTLTYIGEVHSV